jgi:hypothetical protein
MWGVEAGMDCRLLRTMQGRWAVRMGLGEGDMGLVGEEARRRGMTKGSFW